MYSMQLSIYIDIYIYRYSIYVWDPHSSERTTLAGKKGLAQGHWSYEGLQAPMSYTQVLKLGRPLIRIRHWHANSSKFDDCHRRRVVSSRKLQIALSQGMTCSQFRIARDRSSGSIRTLHIHVWCFCIGSRNRHGGFRCTRRILILSAAS